MEIAIGFTRMARVSSVGAERSRVCRSGVDLSHPVRFHGLGRRADFRGRLVGVRPKRPAR